MSKIRTGDEVLIECAGVEIAGTVLLASTNEKSLMLGFEAILDGHVGTMPVLRNDDGSYHSIVTGALVKVRRLLAPQRAGT
jgi:hypothetical protein